MVYGVNFHVGLWYWYLNFHPKELIGRRIRAFRGKVNGIYW